MIRSMTGYGRSQAVVDTMNITVEIKSVNHRYFEFNSRRKGKNKVPNDNCGDCGCCHLFCGAYVDNAVGLFRDENALSYFANCYWGGCYINRNRCCRSVRNHLRFV